MDWWLDALPRIESASDVKSTSSPACFLSHGIARDLSLFPRRTLASVRSSDANERNIGMSTLQASAQKQLRQLVEQIERLEEEKKQLAGDIRDKYLEAKAVGFDVKVLRQIIRLRKKSQSERQEEDTVLQVYLHALGMLDDAAALEQAADAMIAAE